MSRPGIVRADTLDLQDQDAPSAAEHQKHPTQTQNGVAPHQASQLHHVSEERHSEEQSLAEAWNIASNITEEPGAIGEAQANHEQDQATNGTTRDGEEGGEGGETETEGDDDMMDRISSSPSIDDGYLPAEHIETPTERLARLNKHRNIDLSATMLSDNSEKSRNPLKKAMRRRNAKTVQFAAPTYVEASDYDYSSDEDESAMIEPAYGATAPTKEEPQQNGHAEEPAVAESKVDDADDRPGTPTQRESFDREQAATHRPSTEEPQTSPKLVDKTEAAPLKKTKGSPRNRDSFLKDETETRKMTLTPGLLREDSTSLRSISSDSVRGDSIRGDSVRGDSIRGGSTENLVKTTSPPEQVKKDPKKEKKEKQKGGMLSGLFKSKKKDKKSKDDLGAESDMEKPSNEILRSESPKISPATSGRNSPVQNAASLAAPAPVAVDTRQTAPAKQPPPAQAARSKLVKQAPSQIVSPVREQTEAAPQPSGAFMAELEGSQAAFEMATGHEAVITEASQRVDQEQPVQQQQDAGDGAASAIKNMFTPADKEAKPKKAKRAKQRVELDDFDSPDEEGDPNPFKEQEERQRRVSEDTEEVKERLSESPVEIMPGTFMHGTEIVHIPILGEDDEEEEQEQSSESLTSSPSIIEHPAEPAEESEPEPEPTEDDEPTPTAPRSPQPLADAPTPKPIKSPSRELSMDSTGSSLLSPPSTIPSITEQTWSDSSLRSWLDDGSEIRDMLVMINDKSGVTPVAADHPMMAGLYTEQRKGVQKMMGDLDGLLGSYLQRKGIFLA